MVVGVCGVGGGVAAAPVPYGIATARRSFLTNAEVRFQGLWALKLADFGVAYAFLSPAPMRRLTDKAEAEMAKLATSFSFDVTTDFGQIEQVINDKISLNRAKTRVAADLSSEGVEDVERKEAMEVALAEQALKDFEVELGLVTPDTVGISETAKELGPAEKARETELDG